MKEKLIIIGNGGHARMLLDFIEEKNRYDIIGVTSNEKNVTDFYGYPVLGNDEILPLFYNQGVRNVVIGIGGFTNNIIRKKAFMFAITIGYKVERIIHSSAIVSKYARLNDGIVVMPNVVINNDVQIGQNCIIANSAVISHETIIEDHVLISAGVTIGGYARIGEGSLIALGAKVVSGAIIGKNVLVAAGSVVTKNIPDGMTVYGIPAKPKP